MGTGLAIGYLVLCVFCALKESKTTGLFKTFGVYGRLTAYLGLFCPIGLVMFIASFFTESMGVGFPQNMTFLLLAAFGAVFYVIAYLKCPAFLKKKCIPCMMLSGFGLCIKICVFFLGFVWKLTGPQEMSDGRGNIVYYYDGNVYDQNGTLLGKASADRQSYVPKQ